MTHRNHYEVLGVDRAASKDEIVKAFRIRSRQLHPAAGGDEAEFMALSLAYKILSDKKTRKAYDLETLKNSS